MTFEEYQKQWFEFFASKGHELIVDEDGDADIFVTAAGHCNGPGCKKCGYSTCWHCTKPENIPECHSK